MISLYNTTKIEDHNLLNHNALLYLIDPNPTFNTWKYVKQKRSTYVNTKIAEICNNNNGNTLT